MTTLYDLLEIENDSFFAECVCPSTGVLVWPTIRNIFFRLIISDMFYSSRPLVDTGRELALFPIGKGIVRTAWHNIAHPPRSSSVLTYATGAGLMKHNRFSRNRYTHYFSEVLPLSFWSLEGLFNYEWPLPREGGRLSFSFPGLAAISLYSRFFVTPAARRIAKEMVERAAHRAKRFFGWRLGDARWGWLIKYAAQVVTGYPLKKKWLTRWLEKVEPFLFLAEEGCYGHMAILNATARECGVSVAEYQHGVVTAGHDAYNVAPALERSENFRRTLPDYFLGYGEWWNRQFNAPTKKVVIGNPHREAVLNRPMSEKKQGGMILVLGEGVETNSYLEYCRELKGLLSSKHRVVFRPHPMERSRIFASMDGVGKDIDIDREHDIYTSLAKADAVVAELSTGLFEAVGIVRRIFVWNTPKSRFGLPNHPFASFDTLADLARKIQEDRTSGVVSMNALEEIWASNWKGRFRDFIDGVLFNKGGGKMGKAILDSEHER